MNRGVKLLILLGVLIAVIITAVIVVEKTKPEKIPLSYVSGDSIKQIDLSQMTRLQWTWGEEEYDFSYSAEGFKCNIQPDYVPDSERMQNILRLLQDIRAEKVITEPQELSVYGLDVPSCIIKVGDVELHIGNESVLNSTCYMSMGDGNVYMVENTYYHAFAYTREKMVQLGEIPQMTDLTKITLENSNGAITVEKHPQEGKTYSDYYEWFVVGDDSMISQDVVYGIIAYLEDMDWLECLDSAPQNMADYGLDTPAVTCTVEWDGGSYTFYVGSETDQGYYATAEGENRVYLLDVTTSQVLAAVSNDMLACTDVLKMDWTTVTSVDVEMDGQIVTIAAKDDGWYIGDRAVDAATVFEAIASMPATPDRELTGTGTTTELKLTIHRNTETFTTVVLTFYRLDGTNCVMQLDDHAPMTVLREDVVLLKEAFNTLILG